MYIIIQKIAPRAKSGKYFQIWFFPRFGEKKGGVLSMHMQVIRDCLMDSPFACPGSAPIGGGKKGEFGDWSTTNYNLHLVRKYGRKSSANSRERRSKKAKSLRASYVEKILLVCSKHLISLNLLLCWDEIERTNAKCKF